jgi:hypothetical protein
VRLGILLLVVAALAGCAKDTTPPPESLGSSSWTPPGGAPPVNPDAWPRQFPEPDATLVMYQPQVESWVGNQLAFRAAIARGLAYSRQGRRRDAIRMTA